MNRLSLIIKQKIFNIIFILIALLIGILIFLYINNLKAKIPDNINYKVAIISSTEINKGQEITEDLIEKQEIPEVILNQKVVQEKDSLLGKVANQNIAKGEIIYKDFIEGFKSSPSFDSYIPSGLRAVSIPIKFYGNIDFIKPGINVDIISTYFDSNENLLFSETILKNKEIIFASFGETKEIENTSGVLFEDEIGLNYPSGVQNLVIMTFYLSPEESEKIFLAMQKGILNLAICPNYF